MSFRRSLVSLSVLLSLNFASHGEVQQLLQQGGFEFPPVQKRLSRAEKGDVTKMPIDREWIEFKDDLAGKEGGNLIIGLTPEQKIEVGRGQSIFVNFDKVTKKFARASLSSDLISILPGKTYRFGLYGRVDKTNPVALDTRLPMLKLRVDWFKKVTKSESLKDNVPDEMDDKDEKEDAEAPEDDKATGDKPAEAVKKVEPAKEAGAIKAEPIKAGPVKKAPETKAEPEKKTAPGAKPAAAPKEEAAEPEEEEDMVLVQTGRMEMRSQTMPGAKDRKPFFVAGAWREFFANIVSAEDAQYVKVTWTWETPGEEGETNGVMYFDGASIEGEPGPQEADPLADSPEYQKEMEEEKNNPNVVSPDDPEPGEKPALGGKGIPAVPITPPKPAEPPKPAPVR